MKTILVFALCATFASIASAGSIQWGMNMGRNGYVADYKGDKLNGDIYFILTSSASTLEAAVGTDTFETTLNSVKLDSMTLTNGKNNSAINTVTKDESILKVDQTYSFSILVFDAVNKQYYISAALSEKAYDEGADVVTASGVTFDTSHVGSSYAANWSKTVPVPEPSTAALALAGLALLLKRRKA